jgi:hypothetical protein
MIEKEPQRKSEAELNIEKYANLADKLDELQVSKNDGRGVSCVRGIIFELRRGNVDSAKAICNNEGDKLRNYPDIVKLIEEGLLEANLYLDLSKWFKNEDDN